MFFCAFRDYIPAALETIHHNNSHVADYRSNFCTNITPAIYALMMKLNIESGEFLGPGMLSEKSH